MKAILSYKTPSGEKIHRILCDTEKSKLVCDHINRNGAKIGNIYITTKQQLFIKSIVDKALYFPRYTAGRFSPLTPTSLQEFQDGQEALKDYIAQKYPDEYVKHFDDAEGIRNSKKTKSKKK